MIGVQSEPIDVPAVLAAVQGDAQGGVVLFVGRVRSATAGRAVRCLEYEAYAPMAARELERLADTARASHGAESVALVHRTGRLEVGEAAVAIAVASAHRAQAFAACSWLIDTLKQQVPIWKKEIYEDGSEWISPTP